MSTLSIVFKIGIDQRYSSNLHEGKNIKDNELKKTNYLNHHVFMV